VLENGKIISGNGAETRLKNKTERKKAVIGGGEGTRNNEMDLETSAHNFLILLGRDLI